MFVRVLPCLVALWALSGFYLSLGPGLATRIVGSGNLLWGGLVIFLLCGSGGVAVVVGKSSTARSAMLYGCACLFIGVGLTFGAVATSVFTLFAIGSVIAGIGFGLSFLGAFRLLSGLAAPFERAGTIAAIYIVSYLAFSIPIVIAGIAARDFGTHDVALVFSAAVAVLAAMGTVAGLAAHEPAQASQHFPSRNTEDLTPCPGTVPPCANPASTRPDAPGHQMKA
jgi:MFS family permease